MRRFMTLGLKCGHVSYLRTGWFQHVFSWLFMFLLKSCFMFAIFAEDSRFGSYLYIFVYAYSK